MYYNYIVKVHIFMYDIIFKSNEDNIRVNCGQIKEYVFCIKTL